MEDSNYEDYRHRGQSTGVIKTLRKPTESLKSELRTNLVKSRDDITMKNGGLKSVHSKANRGRKMPIKKVRQ